MPVDEPRHIITFKRVEFLKVEVTGFPDAEYAWIQGNATPDLVIAAGTVVQGWEPPAFNAVTVHEIHEVPDGG